jgi:hypothetical protein
MFHMSSMSSDDNISMPLNDKIEYMIVFMCFWLLQSTYIFNPPYKIYNLNTNKKSGK